MSWLKFERSTGQIDLFEGEPPQPGGDLYGPALGSWPAHNETTATSNGAWPAGTYPWSHYNAHPEAGLAPGCHATAYGCYGIHVFSVPNRPGLGIHAGRTKGEPGVLGGKTLGCLRLPIDAMMKINDRHNADPLRSIVVRE